MSVYFQVAKKADKNGMPEQACKCLAYSAAGLFSAMISGSVLLSFVGKSPSTKGELSTSAYQDLCRA